MGTVFRTALFTILVPGLVAVLIPHRLLPPGARPQWSGFGLPGLLLLAAGACVYLWCAFWAFAWVGHGTPAPMDPPRRLVVHGLYRFVRNPMYLGVSGIIIGQAVLFRSIVLVEYWLVWGLFVFLFVLSYEEPTLRRKFGADYDAYCREVPRWLPRFPRVKGLP